MADERLFGREATEQAQGYEPMPAPVPDKDPELERADAITNWTDDRVQQEAATKSIIQREYVQAENDKPQPDNRTITAERAAKDLVDLREAEAALAEMERDIETAAEIDVSRAQQLDALNAQQPEAQQSPHTPLVSELQQPQSTPTDGVDPEVRAALSNPKVLNAIAAERQADTQKVDAAISSAAQWSQQNAEIAAAAIMARPELRGIPASQLPGALAALAKANPEAAQQIQNQIQQVQVLTQQAAEAQRTQQQRSAIQFQQAAAQHDAEFDRQSAASGETVEQRNEVARYAHQMLRDSGLSDIDIAHHWNNNPLLRSVTGQRVLADAARYRMLKAGIPNKVFKPIPQVVRPGTSVDRPDATGRADFAIERRLSGPLSVKDATELTLARRARSSR